MQLRQAFNVQRGDVVAFTGAGGKTSTMFRLAHELTNEGWRVICTTTTRLAAEELAEVNVHLQVRPQALRPEAITRALNNFGTVFLYDSQERNKIIGLPPELIDTLIDSVDSDVILIEADGARRMPFKAPYSHEPVIPTATTLAVPIAGYDSIGLPLDDEHVYNPTAMIERYGYPAGELIKSPWVACVLRDEVLGLKGIPLSARIVALLNKVPYTVGQRIRARVMSRMILRQPRVSAVAIGAVLNPTPIMEVQRRVAAIVLAGGMSSRMGQPKVLLPWDGRPIIRVIVDRLKRLRLDDLVVITGHMAPQVAEALKHEPVRLVHNRNYKEGDMLSSLQAGLRALGSEYSACMVVLGDQPQIDNRVVLKVLNSYAEGRGSIVVPSYNNRRGHPIIIDRKYWPEILSLPNGAAPRDVINQHADHIAYVNVDTDSILRDIDTPQDYQDERRRAGLS